MVIVNYKGVIVGAPLLPLEVMGIVLIIALVRAVATYEVL
jgi:hypothetical protein